MVHTSALMEKIPLGLLGVKLLVLAAKTAELVVSREHFHLAVKPEKYQQHFSQFRKGTITFLLALFNLGTRYTRFFFSFVTFFNSISLDYFFPFKMKATILRL